MTGKGMKISSFTKYLRLRVINTGVSRLVVISATIVLFIACPAKGQNTVLKPSKSEALTAWDRGDFERAYNHFNGLLLLYTRDPLYQYYAGACLVRMERDIQRAVTLLSSAINSSVNIKSVPDEVWFYYGRALQMSSNFNQAVDAFERFSKLAGKKVAAGYNVGNFIDQCNAGTGAFSLHEAVLPAAREVAAGKDKVPGVDERPAVAEAAGKETANVTGKPETGRPETTTSDVSRPGESTPEANKGSLPVVRGDTSGIPAGNFRVLGEALEHPEKADSLLIALESSSGLDKENPEIQPEVPTETGRLTLFEMRKAPAYNDTSPVPVDPVMPDGLFYTVQIAAFRNNVAPSLFKGLFPVFGKRRPGSDAIYYYTGMFRRLDDARLALPEARGAGFTDAFIIAMMDGIQVSIERAQMLEKEWGSKTLPGSAASSAMVNNSGSVANGKTSAGVLAGGNPSLRPDEGTSGQPASAGTLSFRAEVMRISKPVKPDVIQKIELLAGTRGLDMIKNSEGETVFLIGNFITFESADDYVSLLIRNGYSEARVAAYVGMQEIPVQAARELLNKIPDD